LTQLWVIIFVAVLALAFGVAHWLDCDEAKRRAGMCAEGEQDDAVDE
jgi:uncharacterized membrane protein YidH (DUF202 family)